jgi:hypothetical protein
MLKEDFSQQGVSLVLPDDPSYGSELERLGFSNNPAEASVRPASVLIKNTSHHTVIAFGISWTKRHLRTGSIAPSHVSGSQPFGLLDGNRPHYDGPMEGTIPPGTSRLVTAAGMVQTADDLGKTIGLIWKEWAFEKVQLDSIVFDNGEAFGPDHLGVVKGLKARVETLQDLTQEIFTRFSQGEQLRAVLEELSSVAPSKSEVATLSPFDPSNVPTLVRQQYLDELATTAKNFGDEVARGRLHQLMYTTRPTIRWTESVGK